METACQYDSVVIAPSFLERILDQARSLVPQECCGVLGGRGSVVTSVYALTNDSKAENEFFANLKELFDAIRSMRNKNEEMIGIYHSHPSGPPEPSPSDVERNYYPGLFYLIVSLEGRESRTKCFIMSENRTFSPIQIV